MTDCDSLLQLDDVHAYYGLSHVLQGVSLRIPRGAIVSLMGRNGVGKSTTLKSVCGLVPVRRGRITFAGRDIVGQRTHEIARLDVVEKNFMPPPDPAVHPVRWRQGK